MIIGMNVSDIKFKGIDRSYLDKFMALRSVFAIGLMVAIIAGEFFLIDMLGNEEREFLALVPLFPIAANITVFASFLGSKEKESGLLVLCSMGLSLILIPIVIQFFD
jgi:malate permease and related proteins